MNAGILWINRGPKGWSEIYMLPELDFDAAERTLAELAEARSWVLAAGCEIVLAATRQLKRPPEQRLLAEARRGSLLTADDEEYWLPPNTCDDCLWLDQTTIDGRYVSRPVHAPADDEIIGDSWVRFPLELPPGPPVRPVDPAAATKEELWLYFLGLVRDRTLYARPLGTDAAGNTNWETSNWNLIRVSGAGKKDVGRRWLLASWEAGDYSFAPPWSPCGTIVAALRTLYEAPCRFYVDGPETSIRWYVAADDAELMTRKTIFFPYAEHKGYVRGDAAGERTPFRKAWWSAGYSWSMAPGTTPVGTDAEFLGLGFASYDQAGPTPPELLPECDAMMPILKVGYSAGLVIVDNCTLLTFEQTQFGVEHVTTNHGHVTILPFPTPEMLATMYAVASNMSMR